MIRLREEEKGLCGHREMDLSVLPNHASRQKDGSSGEAERHTDSSPNLQDGVAFGPLFLKFSLSSTAKLRWADSQMTAEAHPFILAGMGHVGESGWDGASAPRTW